METETTLNHCTPTDAKHVLADELQWDEARADDKEFLKLWYQSRVDKWSKHPKEIGGKIVAHYKKAVRELS